MKQNPEKKSRITRLIAGIMVLVSVSATLVSVSYSWIKRQWTPTVSGQNIRIEASGSLAFKLDGSGTATNSVSLTDGLGSSFVLHPVSNSSGMSDDFFTLNREAADELGYYYQHITGDGTPSGWKDAGREYGYIETSFYILYGEGTDGSTTDGRIKYIYLDTAELKNTLENTFPDASQAARVSITVEKAGQTVTYILGTADNTAAEAITNEKDGDTWLAHGASYFLVNGDVRTQTDGGSDLHKTVHVEDMTYYDGGFRELPGQSGTFVDPSKCLFEMQSRTVNKKVTVRIWLEGCDPLCTDEIAGLQLDALLSFSAIDCSTDFVTVNGIDYYPVIEQGTSE